MLKSGRKRPELPLEERIKADNHARDAFKTLVNAGAGESYLWRRLEDLEFSQDVSFARWEDQSRLTKKQARVFAKRLKADAAAIRGFFTDYFWWHLTANHRHFGWLELVQKHLCLTSRLIEGLLRMSDDRGADPTRGSRRRLEEFVRKTTGKPHDREVTELISKALGTERHVEAQRKARTRKLKTGRN